MAQSITTMRSRNINIAIWISLTILLTSCFKEEPLNAECDIEQAWVHVAQAEDFFLHSGDTILTITSDVNHIEFVLKDSSMIGRFAPHFKITDGATISPASGTEHDFSHGPVTYVVTSEDKAWRRTYTVGFRAVGTSLKADTISLDFEHYALDPSSKFYLWQNQQAANILIGDWASGNPGFALSVSSAKPMDYPTTPLTTGKSGAAVQLTTRSTGPFGALVNKRLAAGNLFLGSFDVQKALSAPLTATRMGIRYNSTSQPVKFTGYYTYRPGDNFQDEKGNSVAYRTDSAAIYAVLYLNRDGSGQTLVLDGSNITTHPNIVAIARLNNVQQTQNWNYFEVPFQYRIAIDPEKLTTQGYSLAIVFSSSHEGDHFRGAIGSTLCVDEVKIICEKR